MKPLIIVGILAVILISTGVGAWYWFSVRTAPAPGAEDAAQTNTAPTPTPSLHDSLIGAWRSEDDAKFTRVFSADGTVTDGYTNNNDATAIGAWRIVDDGNTVPATLPNLASGTLLEIAFPEETLLFVVSKVTSTELVMTYVDGNGQPLRFVRF